MKFKLSVGHEEREFEAHLRGEMLTLIDEGGNRHELRLLDREGSRLTLQLGQQTVPLWGVRSGEGRQVWVNGRLWRYGRVEGGQRDATPDPGALCVTIPAVVSEVLVHPGDVVGAGDPLVLLESMKMVLSVQAPQDGVITEVLCQSGQSVDPGVALVEMTFS